VQVRLYWEVSRRTFRRMTTYRAATFAGVFTNTVFGFLFAYVMVAVYQQRSMVGSFDLTDALTFTFVTQGLAMVVTTFGNDSDISDRIKSGDVVIDLYRPVDYQGYWAAESYGKAAFYAIFRGIPPFVIGAIAFHLRLPAGVGTWLGFAATVAVAVAVSYGWRFILQCSAFWLLDVRGPNQIGMMVAMFMSGMFISTVFFPPWLATVGRWLPFASMMQVPGETFLGKHTGVDLFVVLVVQVAWAVALLAGGRLMLRRALRRVVVQGG
jgi:ABC-2 type transport system permease protein